MLFRNAANVFLFVALTVSVPLIAIAQSPAGKLPTAPSISYWQQVQALPPGADVYVKTDALHLRCTIGRVGANSLVCNGLVVQRANIVTIKRPRRLLSTLAGAGIGIAAGVVLGEATYRNNIQNYDRGDAALGGGVLFGSIGAIVGYFTDFTRSTIY